ncbi:MAG: hypothetical protein Q4E77_05220 [Conchiformibius sp.]|nr:hypothetical protein [Conchiformibius sp.]
MAFVWGKRDLQTALALKRRLKSLKVSYERIAGDDWDAFVNAFSDAGDQLFRTPPKFLLNKH